MKNKLCGAFGAAVCVMLAAFVLAGCGSSPKTAGLSKGNPNWPSFVLNPPSAEDVVYGVGGAKMATSQATMQFAENRARVSLAQTIGASVKNRIVDLQQGSEGDPALQQFQQSISETLARAQLSGTKVVAREETGDGTLWVLMSLPKNEAKRAAIAAMGQNPNKKLADTALKEMDAAFAKADIQPVEH